MEKIVTRMCIVTREIKLREELIRIVNTPSGILIDKEGNLRGRGAYLSKDKTVIETAKRKHLLNRALRVKVDDSIYDELISLL